MLKFFAIFIIVVFGGIVLIVTLNKPDDVQIKLYQSIQKNIPYSLEYNFGKGFEIINKKDSSVMYANDNNIHQTMEKLQSEWISSHIRINNNQIVVLDDNNGILDTFIVQNDKDMVQIKEFFKLK